MKNITRTACCYCFLVAFLFTNHISAQVTDSFPTPLTPKDRPIKLYLLDYPMNFKDGYYFPSYNQSIYTAVAVQEIVNKNIGNALDPIHPFWGKVLTVAATVPFNALYSYVPTGTAWQHQEAHRAIIRNRGIHSYNEANEFKFFSKRIATKKVTDQDLIDFKRDYPAEFIRNRGAGHESQLEMIEQIKKNAFFYGTPGHRDIVVNLLNSIVTIQYLNEFRQKDYDEAIDLRNQKELTPDVRDIHGVEFTPWVYDLFRPDEPYEVRGTNGGVHPYGVGVDRYIGNVDLTPEEMKYLKKQGRLAWLNLISPHNFGFARFKLTNPFNSKPMFGNFSVVHNINGFGQVIDFNIFLQQNKWNLFFTYHNYSNKDRYFPGVNLEVHRFPLKKVFISGMVGGWVQPKDQMFFAKSGTPGGIIRLGVASRLYKKLEWFVEGDMKTDGWVSGVVSLEPQGQFQFGLNWLY